MLKVIITGCGGIMGKNIAAKVKEEKDMEIAFGVDPQYTECDFAVYKNIAEATEKGDVIIDFSHHSAIKDIIDYAKANSTPIVLATTGHTEEENAIINEASKSIAIFKASNMSLGIALLSELVKKAADSFPDADIELVEMHHNKKIDSPSGTCKSIMEIIKESRPNAEFVFGRCGMEKREKDEIGVHSIRLGGEVGTHQIIISTNDEVITLEHKVYSRSAFAYGAVNAAKYIVSKNPGIYTMKDYLRK